MQMNGSPTTDGAGLGVLCIHPLIRSRIQGRIQSHRPDLHLCHREAEHIGCCLPAPRTRNTVTLGAH
jgi:hypothetical protein